MGGGSWLALLGWPAPRRLSRSLCPSLGPVSRPLRPAAPLCAPCAAVNPHHVIFVMDGSIGQAAFDQAKAFHDTVDVRGVLRCCAADGSRWLALVCWPHAQPTLRLAATPPAPLAAP